MRAIAERPLFRRPTKGSLPPYLFEDEKQHFKTSNLNKQIGNYIFKNPQQTKSLIKDFSREFVTEVSNFQIESNNFKEPYDEMIYNNIVEMIPLRNDYVEFLNLICSNSQVFDVDTIVNIFEEIYLFSEYQGKDSYIQIIADHYKFFINELFIYTATILIDKGMFVDLHTLLNSRFFVKNRFNSMKNGVGFEEFRFYVPSLDDIRNKRLSLKKVSVSADLIIQRSSINNVNYEDKILAADLILYYVSRFRDNSYFSLWFPTTYIYNQNRRMEILSKMVSKRHFEKIKVLFGVNTKDEMKSLIEKYDKHERGYNNAFESIPQIIRFINPDEICTFS